MDEPIRINPDNAAELQLWSDNYNAYVHRALSLGGRSRIETDIMEKNAAEAADRAVLRLRERTQTKVD
jgi:hypothetical protein